VAIISSLKYHRACQTLLSEGLTWIWFFISPRGSLSWFYFGITTSTSRWTAFLYWCRTSGRGTLPSIFKVCPLWTLHITCQSMSFLDSTHILFHKPRRPFPSSQALFGEKPCRGFTCFQKLSDADTIIIIPAGSWQIPWACVPHVLWAGIPGTIQYQTVIATATATATAGCGYGCGHGCGCLGLRSKNIGFRTAWLITAQKLRKLVWNGKRSY